MVTINQTINYQVRCPKYWQEKKEKKKHLYRRLNGQFLAGTNESEDASQHTRVYIHMYI